MDMPGFQMVLLLFIVYQTRQQGGEQICSTSCSVPEMEGSACVDAGDLYGGVGGHQGAPQSPAQQKGTVIKNAYPLLLVKRQKESVSLKSGQSKEPVCPPSRDFQKECSRLVRSSLFQPVAQLPGKGVAGL